MEEAIKRFLNDLNEDFAAEIYKYFGYDPDAEDIDIEFFETLLSRRPEILDNFFSYIKPYLDDPNFYASFDLTDESVLQKIFFSKIFISDEVYFRFIDEAIKQRDSKELPLVVMSSSDIDELLKRGYSLEEIANFELFSDSVCIELYNRDRSLYRKILRGYSTNLGYIVAKEYVSGNKDALGAYLDKFLFDKRFADVLDALSNYSINIKQFISDVGVFVNFDKDVSYSLIDDDVLLQKLINSWGPEAVIFGSTISKESAQLAADFTYDDYIFYDGSIKKSPYILLNLLNKGYTEALFNCDYRAINEDVIEFIKTHDFRYEDIAKSETLLSSYLINKMLTDIGYTGIIIHTSGALHDVNAFNYVYDYFKNKYSSDEHIYSFYGSEVPVVKAFALGEDMGSSTYTVSPEVAERMIELGLDFKTFLEKYKRIKGLDQAFYAKGEKYALFASDDWNFINDHLDEVTYDDFLSFISMHSFDGDLNNQFIEKFFKEGHYEVANYLSEDTLRYLDVKGLGLEDISYEDYLKLPDKVKNLPLLKRKFTEKTPDELLALLATDSSTEVVYQALLAGVSPDKILSMSDYYNFDFKTTKLFLEKGCIDAIYQYSYSYSDKDNKKELVELFYKISGGLLPDFSRHIPCEEEFIEFYISKGMYEVLDDIYSFKYIKIDSILGEDYDLELFKKHPVFDGRIINRLITPENQEEVFQVILNHTSKNFSHLERLIIHIIESDLDDNYIYPLSENFSFDINLLIRKSPIEIKDLLSLIYRKNLYEEKRYLDIILKNLTSSQIKSDLATFYVSDSMYMYIIHKMIEAGNYDFVSLYRGRVVISSLKEAIIHGVFPSSLKIDLDEYGRIIDHLSFTDKEIELFRSRLATEPQYALLIPDIKNNFELLIEYLKNAPEYLKLINKEYFKNPRLLVCLVTVDPKMTASYINKETPVETIATLIRVNPEILDYVYSFLITDEVVDLVSASYPEIIDKVSSGTDVAIENAFANGYVINEKSRNTVIMHALLNGIPVPIEVLAKNMGPLFSTMWSTSTYSLFTPEQFYKTFKPYIEALINIDSVEFYFQATKNYYSFDDAKEEYRPLLDEYGLIGLDKIFGYSNDKEIFCLALYIRKNKITEENIDELEPYFEKVKNIVAALNHLRDLFNAYGYGDDRPIYKFIERMAAKYFASDPINLIAFVDRNDPEVIRISKGLLETNHDLYRQVPGVLDDKKVILKLIGYGEDVYSYLSSEFKDDIDILGQSLKINSNNINYINKDNPAVREFLIANLDEYPIAFVAYPEILTSKSLIIKLMNVDYGLVYQYISDDFKRDYDICLAYAMVNSNALFYIPNDIPGFAKIVDAAVRVFPVLFTESIVKPYITQELYEFIAPLNNNAFAYLPIELQTLSNFKLVSDKASFNYDLLDASVLIEIAGSGELEVGDSEEFIKKITSLLLENGSLISQGLSDKLISILKKAIPYISSDNNLFKKFLSLGDGFDYSLFGDEVGVIFKYAREIINSTGKINTMQKNPVFSYDLCKYIYPAFGVVVSRDFIKYNTPAAEKLIDELKKGNVDLTTNYYNFLIEKHILENDDKLVHYAFRDFDKFRNLIIDVLNHKDEMTTTECINLSKVIKNSNYYQINTFAQLKNYSEITRKKTDDILNASDINQIKNYISQLFGFDFAGLQRVYDQFQLGNFDKLLFVRKQIKEKMGVEEYQKLKKDLFYTKDEVKLILLIKQIIYSDNIEEIKDIMKVHLDDEAKDIDYSMDFQKIIKKIRNIYNLQFNLYLTNTEELESPRLDKDDPNNKYGVTIIDMDSERFRFLAHRLYSYDSSNSGFAQMLMDDPSLWFKLEGASTLSTSCFSDKGFWFLHCNDNGGVVYLFNTLPDDAMLFMYGRDLYVEHGGYRLEPTANNNAFSDVDGLIQSSNYHSCSYNEVALFREGMIPCAIACTGPEPTPEQIRAAKFFSEYTGKDIPIIRFNMPAYSTKKAQDFQKNKDAYQATLDIDLIEPIILNGIDCNTGDLIQNISFCFDTAKDAYQNGRITSIQFFQYMTKIIRTVNRLENSLKDVQKEITRITLYRQSLIALCGMDRETIRVLNNAEMGESGLMYRLDEDEKSYLVKPAVEKGTFRRQDFRAEIQGASSKLQSILSPDTTVEVDVIRANCIALSKQDLINVNKEKTQEFESWVRTGGELDENIKNGLLREYVIDFLLCNFDCYYGNFVIDTDGNIRGIDKEQSFRFMNDSRSLNPDFSFIPNGSGRVPIYQLLFERYRKGEITLDFSVVTDTIEKARSISDDDYKEMFRSYAMSLDKYKAEEILDKICSRRMVALERIEEFINNLGKGVKM